MSVQSEIDRINGNVANTYSVLSEMGATMPEQQNSDNLAQTARTVPVGGGVQSDWNQTDESAADFIKNKPFGEFGGDTLEWDGNTDGLLNVMDLLHKVSDATPTYDDFANGAEIVIDGTVLSMTVEDIYNFTGAILLSEYAAIVHTAGFDLEGLVFPEKGTYLFGGEGSFVNSLAIPGYTGFPVTKKIKEKFLPATTFFVNLLEETLGAEKFYLYTDLGFSVKATKADITSAVRSGNANVEFRRYGELNGIASLLYAALSNDYVQVFITTGVLSGDAIGVYLFTAEYTP